MKQVGVFIPKTARVHLQKVKSFLAARGVVTSFEVDLSEGPDGLRGLIVKFGLEAAVLIEVGEPDSLRPLSEALERAGIAPYALEVVSLPSVPFEREAAEQAKLLSLAAVERLRAQGQAGPEHLKPSFLPKEGIIHRRDLLFGFLRPRYEVVPAVEGGVCTAWKGCALCLASCPQGAITFREGAAFIDKAKCTACGACLSACPLGAIRSPTFSPEAMDAQLRALLLREGISLESRVLLFSSEDSHSALKGVEAALPPQLLEVKLPCIGALSAWLLFRGFDLGADGIGILPCGPGCRHRCDPEGWKQTFRFVQALLVRIGIEAGRLRAYPVLDREPLGLVAGLQDFVGEVKAMGPPLLRGQKVDGPRLDFIDLLRDLSRRFPLEKTAPLTGEEVPFGVVEVVGRCTLCRACPDRCPTGALAMHEDLEASTLSFNHARCIACGACVKVCPEKVLKMERALDFTRLTAPSILAEDRMVRCRRCGKAIAPQGMVQKVQHLLSPQPLDVEVCPSCRLLSAFRGGDG